MTSTNHFRGRRLTQCPTQPVSPRRKRTWAVIPPTPLPYFAFPFTAAATTGFGSYNITDGNPVFTNVGGDNWQGDGTASDGTVYRINVSWDGTAGGYTVSFFCKLGGTYRNQSGTPLFGSIGTPPFSTPSTPWPTNVQATLVGSCVWTINHPYPGP